MLLIFLSLRRCLSAQSGIFFIVFVWVLSWAAPVLSAIKASSVRLTLFLEMQNSSVWTAPPVMFKCGISAEEATTTHTDATAIFSKRGLQ